MTGLTRKHLTYLTALVCIFIVPLLGYAENSIDKKSPAFSGKITKQKTDQKIKLAASNTDEEDSLFDFPRENNSPAHVGGDDEKQDMMENALELLGEADQFWKNGEIEETLDTLDEAYSLILDANGDPSIAQEKDDLRLLISQRILAVYSSKRDVLQGKNGEIPLLMNGDVQKEITSFQTVERESFLAAYERSGMYRPEILKELKRSGIPEEFFWLPLVESLFKINAYSSARALGLWQFIPSTGYKFGLNRDEWVDERMDVQKSTRAAIAYLKELHSMFGDWLTALAAYNCGEGRVLRVISRQRVNYLDSFWDLYRQLPNETARYVPRFLATLHIVNNPQKYGFDLSHAARPIEFETVRVNRIMKFKDIADRIDTTEDVLCLLNPELRHKMTPDREYDFKVPGGTLDKFNLAYHEIPSSEKPSIAPVQTFVQASDWTRKTYIKHRVKKGETVFSIARKYKVSVSSIRSLNNLSPKKKLIQGRRLIIPVASAKEHAKATAAKKKFQKEITSTGRYKVERGDTLFTIARRFSVSVSELKALNNLASGQIYAGQRLKIPQNETGKNLAKSAQKSRINKKTLSATDINKMGPDKYIVTKNDNLYSIAKKNNTNVARIMELNGLSVDEKIVPGQILVVQ